VKKDHELAGIEILRFVCALGVLIWHYQHFFFRGAWNAELGAALRPTLPLYSVFFIFYENGSLAVPFFWVISGFIFYWQYSAAVRSGAVKFRDFLVRRFSRLYPLHFVTLVLVALGQYVYFESHRETFIYSWNKPIWFASQLLFASNWFTRQPETFNGPIWSVSIEIVICLLFAPFSRPTSFRHSRRRNRLVTGYFLQSDCIHRLPGRCSRAVFDSSSVLRNAGAILYKDTGKFLVCEVVSSACRG